MNVRPTSRDVLAAFCPRPVIAGADAKDEFYPAGALHDVGGVAGGPLEPLLEAAAARGVRGSA